MKKRTRIIATLGPASEGKEIIKQLIQNGVRVFRLNWSHGTPAEHKHRAATIRRAASEERKHIAILCDLQGPKFRVGQIETSQIHLAAGSIFTLVADEKTNGSNNEIPFPHKDFIARVKVNDELSLQDGKIRVIVKETGSAKLCCLTVVGGILGSNQGVAAPKVKMDLAAFTPRDADNLPHIAEINPEYVALSFVQIAGDVEELRKRLADLNCNADIIAKIETRSALDNIKSIVRESDAVMVARGDLAEAVDIEQIPLYQEMIINECRKAGKPVITATQMLDSMEERPSPSRAEVMDIYTAVRMGTDACMLSGETAKGQYPVEAVKTMYRIIVAAERHYYSTEFRSIPLTEIKPRPSNDAQSMCMLAADAGAYRKAACVVVISRSGTTAYMVARERPIPPIICATTSDYVARKMSLVWGVTPVIIPRCQSIDAMLKSTLAAVRQAGLAAAKDKVVLLIIGSRKEGSHMSLQTMN